jgi:prefoldin alpha subunit
MAETYNKNEEKELREKVTAYRILESRIKGLAQQREFLASKILEVRTTMASMDDVVKSKGDVLFSLGSEAHVRGNIKDKENLIVEIGAGIALEKNVEDARVTLERRLKELEDAFSNLQNEIVRVSSTMSELESQLEAVRE